MDKRSVIELIGVLSVVASLIFVGVQIRQSAQETRAATMLQLKDSWVQLNAIDATEDMARAWETVDSAGFENADYRSRHLVTAMLRAVFHLDANAYYLYRLGTLPLEQWLPHLRDVEDISVNPTVIEMWGAWKHIYDDPFVALMDSAIAANSDQPRRR